MGDGLGLLDRFRNEITVIKHAKYSFFIACCIIGGFIWLVLSSHYGAIISEQNLIIQRQAVEINLQRSNVDARPSLKKRALEIAADMMRFAGQWDIGPLTQQQKNMMDNAYGREFYIRANQLYADLDHAGLDTKHLYEILPRGMAADTIRAAAEEITRLVEKLPD